MLRLSAGATRSWRPCASRRSRSTSTPPSSTWRSRTSPELHATTRDLQWIVDAYNLAFAGLVLTAGSLGDRFGRRPALLPGLGGFALASGSGRSSTPAGR